MVCWDRIKPRQTRAQRDAEVKKAIENLDKKLQSGQAKARVSPQGAIAFEGWVGAERGDLSDACAYRKIMAEGSASAKLAIQRAEQIAGRSVSGQALEQGIHGHFGPDGGITWHDGHKR